MVRKIGHGLKSLRIEVPSTGSSEGPGEVMESQTAVKMLPDCSPMSQEQIKTLISKI